MTTFPFFVELVCPGVTELLIFFVGFFVNLPNSLLVGLITWFDLFSWSTLWGPSSVPVQSGLDVLRTGTEGVSLLYDLGRILFSCIPCLLLVSSEKEGMGIYCYEPIGPHAQQFC